MIARQYRFHGYGSLNYVYRQGKTARNRYCLLRFTANPRRTNARVAVVVAKKIHKSAVVRNRIRRRLFAAIESGVGDWPAVDLVFTGLDDQLAAMTKKDIDKIIMQLLQTSGLSSRTVEK